MTSRLSLEPVSHFTIFKCYVESIYLLILCRDRVQDIRSAAVLPFVLCRCVRNIPFPHIAFSAFLAFLLSGRCGAPPRMRRYLRCLRSARRNYYSPSPPPVICVMPVGGTVARENHTEQTQGQRDKRMITATQHCYSSHKDFPSTFRLIYLLCGYYVVLASTQASTQANT